MELNSVITTPRPAQDIYPLEVWDLILDCVKSPYDLPNCSQTCKDWEKLLERKKTSYLMPQVFPILYKYLVSNNETEDEVDDDPQADAVALVPPVLNMRRVCRYWKEAVDTLFQDHSAKNDNDDFDDGGYADELPKSPYAFSEDNVTKLINLASMDFPKDCNPFITRCVYYEDPIGENDEGLRQQLRTNFITMLQSFGKQIWKCHLSFMCSYTISERHEFYILLRRCLILMPNLKILNILNHDYTTSWVVKSMDNSSFRVLLRRYPMPTLKHLEKLSMQSVQFPISGGILVKNPQLRKLSVDFDGYEIVPQDIIRRVMFPNIEQLTVNLRLKVDYQRQFQNIIWKNLKSLNLTVRGKDLQNVIAAVSASSFASSLENFILMAAPHTSFYKYRDKISLENVSLELPKLKKFKFSLFVSLDLKTIDFLAMCTELEEITLEILTPSPHIGISNSVIQFSDCIASMQDSNIWQLLPMLKDLQIVTANRIKRMRYIYTKDQTGKITSGIFMRSFVE